MNNASPVGQTLPLSRTFPVVELFDMDGDAFTIEADAGERAAIARDFSLEAVTFVRANLKVKPQGKTLHVAGTVKAVVTQICVVTLEPFQSEINEPVDVRFSSDPKALSAASEDVPGNEAEWVDPPDPITGDHIDLGLLVAEHLALGIDPYPRKSDAVFTSEDRESGSGEDDSPFAALQGLK